VVRLLVLPPHINRELYLPSLACSIATPPPSLHRRQRLGFLAHALPLPSNPPPHLGEVEKERESKTEAENVSAGPGKDSDLRG
jgi:hypothetical protein